jgi:tRNA(Ile)-lysidine synthetase-like protein
MINIFKFTENLKFTEIFKFTEYLKYIELYRYNIILGIILLLGFGILYRCFVLLTKKEVYPNNLLEFPKNYNFGMEDYRNNEIKNNHLYKILKDFIEPEKNYIVSLSGGVDSMVVLFMLYNIFEGKTSRFVTASVNYNQRFEAKDEMKFLVDFLKLYKIKNYCKTVESVKRHSSENTRKQFEETSQQIRYDLYREIIKRNEYDIDNTIILLGHHRDDLRENILNNFMLGRKLTDLEVMKKVVRKRDLTFGRPLLDYDKNEIYKISHRYDIPYFLDTTPDWSKRGLMRRKLLPLLREMYGDNFDNKLDYNGLQSNMLNNMMLGLIDPFLNDLSITEMEDSIIFSWDNEKYVEKNVFVWGERISRIMHRYGKRMIKRNSLELLINKKYKNYNMICKDVYVKSYMKQTFLRIIK